MNHIYLYEGPFEKGDKGYPMIKEAARRYALENDLNLDLEQAEIVREEKGKPYFADLPLEFSPDSQRTALDVFVQPAALRHRFTAGAAL